MPWSSGAAPRTARALLLALTFALEANGASAPLSLAFLKATSSVPELSQEQLYRLFDQALRDELSALTPPAAVAASATFSVTLSAMPLALGKGKQRDATVRFTLSLDGPGSVHRDLHFEQRSRVLTPRGARVMARVTVQALRTLLPAEADAGFPELTAITAVRTSTAPDLDGRVDEPSWGAAPVFSKFVEHWPETGATPTQRTEVRVLYDDSRLYIGVICFDDQPELISHVLGRRDTSLATDSVDVMVDSALDRRSAFFFSVSAAGGIVDGLAFGDVDFTDTWDAVWEGRAAERPDGWSVEIAIPLSILRFPASADEQRWGFHVLRNINRTHQLFESTLIPPGDDALVSRFGVLQGLKGLKPTRHIEVAPYLAARLAWQPQFSDTSRPQPRLFEPSADVGLDLKATLFSDLSLSFTLNPDFGQVEADELVLNLTNFEPEFPEKRPFFNQGLDLFAPVGSSYGPTHTLFYSRRVGLDGPLLAAAKVTGTIVPRWSLGVLDAVVLGPSDPGKARVAYGQGTPQDRDMVEANPDRSATFHSTRPLHLGLNSQLPAERPTPRNLLAVVTRADVSDEFSLGATFAAATPLAPRCVPSDFQDPAAYVESDCRARGSQVLGVDWNLRSKGRDWGFFGTLDGSRREGGPDTEVLIDGTRVHPSDLGYGGSFRAGRLGGEGVRAALSGDWASPRLDLNQLGYLAANNSARLGFELALVKTQNLDRLRVLQITLSGQGTVSTDQRWTPLGKITALNFFLLLPSYDSLSFGARYYLQEFDQREIFGSGAAFERRHFGLAFLTLTSDPNRRVDGSLTLSGSYAPAGPVPAQFGYVVSASVAARPFSRLETRLNATYSNSPNGPRFVDVLAGPDGPTWLFGQQDAQTLSVTLRQSVVMTPTLSLIAYAQLFTGAVQYPRYFSSAPAEGKRLGLSALEPYAPVGSYDLHDASLNANVVLRWEYRLGSTLFLVYTHARNELGRDGPPSSASLWPLRLGPGPAVDTVQLKWSLWLGR